MLQPVYQVFSTMASNIPWPVALILSLLEPHGTIIALERGMIVTSICAPTPWSLLFVSLPAESWILLSHGTEPRAAFPGFGRLAEIMSLSTRQGIESTSCPQAS